MFRHLPMRERAASLKVLAVVVFPYAKGFLGEGIKNDFKR
jgi:hypothetical protein